MNPASLIYTTETIAQIVGGNLLSNGNSAPVSRLMLDSRKITAPSESIFIAIKGEHHDGHDYINYVYEAGIKNFIIEKEIDISVFPSASIVLVENAVKALQSLAAFHRSQFNIPVIGITGSNGKTIVKEWLNTLLADDFIIVRSPKSYNSQIGVPLSIWNMEASNTLGIFEAGISQPGEMEKLARLIQPTIGIFTNIGNAHNENFLSRRQRIGEKLNLFANTTTIICPDDGDLVQLLAPWYSSKDIILVSAADKNNATINNQSAIVHLTVDGISHTFEIPFTDRASIENAVTCIHCLLMLQYDVQEIQSRLGRLAPLEMRLQLLDGEGSSVIVNDAYSNDLQSLEIALDFLDQHARGRQKTVVLSDILQSGLGEIELHNRVAELLQSKHITTFIGVGKSMSKNAAAYSENSEFFDSTEALMLNKNPADFTAHSILVKGARDFRFERIVQLLQEKTHDSILEIDLGAVAFNLNYFRSKLKPQVKIMAMVKAFGYGAGAHEVASLLQFNKVDYLAVAYTDEGVTLRKAGISLPIMVMNPEQSSLPAMIRHKLEPEIYNLRSLNSVIKALHQADVTVPYMVHIKIDTGMHRLGFILDDLPILIETLLQNPVLKIASVFTHLAATDVAEHDEFTARQLQQFDQASKMLAQKTGATFLKHALNTAGIQRFPDYQLDMVRLGIGLYGVAAFSADQAQLHPVSTLKTIVSQIKKIPQGESVGYARKFTATKDMVIATIPLGYADGLRRSLSNGNGYVIINKQKAYTVGNVCMDMAMVDITAINCNEGDEVEIFGKEITLHQFATMSQTIAYEVLTGISQRVKRLYLQE